MSAAAKYKRNAPEETQLNGYQGTGTITRKLLRGSHTIACLKIYDNDFVLA